MPAKSKEKNKPLIFLKATTIALGIVLMVLVIALIIASQRKSSTKISSCQDYLEINLAGKVEQMEVSKGEIVILTKADEKNRTQEIIKLNSNCVKVINRIKISY